MFNFRLCIRKLKTRKMKHFRNSPRLEDLQVSMFGSRFNCSTKLRFSIFLFFNLETNVEHWRSSNPELFDVGSKAGSWKASNGELFPTSFCFQCFKFGVWNLKLKKNVSFSAFQLSTLQLVDFPAFYFFNSSILGSFQFSSLKNTPQQWQRFPAQ